MDKFGVLILHFCQGIIFSGADCVENCLTIQSIYNILKSERMFVYFNYGRGIKKMTVNKVELLKLILENDDVEKAVLTVAAIISDLLKQHESDQEQVVEYQDVLCQTSPTLL